MSLIYMVYWLHLIKYLEVRDHIDQIDEGFISNIRKLVGGENSFYYDFMCLEIRSRVNAEHIDS
jgi:hypothetical protein